jgi:transcriptional regulator with XRE-family HTH domain
VTPDRNTLADYLRARRELLQPEEVGLARDDNRRVRGLRREEVAHLAGISPEYYLRLEQGRDHQPSDQVLSALAGALLLDAAGRTYLFRLARPAPAPDAPPAPSAGRRVSPGVQALLAEWSRLPAYVSDRNHDILAVTGPGALLAPGYLVPGHNLLTAVFDPAARVHSPDDWHVTASSLVASLRFHSDPRDARLHQLVGALSVRHREFRRMWARHEARPQVSGSTVAHIEELGWITFRWQTLEVPGSGGQFLTTFFGSPGSPAAAAGAYLAVRSIRNQASAMPDAISIN